MTYPNISHENRVTRAIKRHELETTRRQCMAQAHTEIQPMKGRNGMS